MAALDLESGACTTIAGLSGARLLDLRFVLYDAQGVRVVADDVEGGAALVHVCPLVSGRYWLAVSSARGAGAVIYETFESRPGRGHGVQGVFAGTVVPGPPSEALGRQLEAAAAGLLARGAEVVDGPWVETLAEGAVVRRTVELAGGDCYVVAAHAAGDERDVDLFLFDPTGAEVARDLRPGASCVLSHCAGLSGAHTIELRAFEGSGSVAVIVARVPSPSVDAGTPEPALAFDPDAVLEQELARLGRRGFVRSGERVRGAALTTGAVATHELVFGRGCTTVLVAGGAGAGDIDLYLSGADGAELDRDVGLDVLSRVTACFDVEAAVRLEVKMFSGAGGYVMGRAVAPPTMSDLVSTRLDVAGAPYRARGYSSSEPPRRVVLAEGETHREIVSVGARECVGVAAAGELGLLDVDLFVRDPAGRILASDTGPRAWAAVSVCPGAAAGLEVGVRAYRGSGAAALEVLRLTDRTGGPAGGIESDGSAPVDAGIASADAGS